MRIGSIPASYSTESREGRLGNTAAGGGPSFSDVPNLAGTISRVGQNLAAASGAWEEQARKKRDFDRLRQFTQMNGEFLRDAEALKQKLPPDGTGYTRAVEELYTERYGAFYGSLDPDEVEEYNYRAEAFRQPVLNQSFAFEQDALKGNTRAVLDAFLEENLGSIYENPTQAVVLEEEFARRLSVAPGIDEGEARDLARRALKRIQETGFAGEVAGVLRSRMVAPGSPESAEVFDALIQQESGGRADVGDSRPHPKYGGRGGALGIAQVMPETGREIAQKIGDTNFPMDGTLEQQKAYIRKNSYEYGKFYFEEGLTMYGGDAVLALIRYNGGGGAVEAFLRAGRNPAALSGVRRQTREYVEKIYAREGWGNPWTGGTDAISRRGKTPEQLQTIDRLEEEYSEARLSAAQGQAEEDDKRLVTRIDGYINDLQTRIYADPTVASAEMEKFYVRLIEEGVEPEKAQRLVKATEGKVSRILAERDAQEDLTAPLDVETYPGIPYEERRQIEQRELQRREQELLEAQRERKVVRDAAVNAALGEADLGNFGLGDLGKMVQSGIIQFGDEDYFKIKTKVETAQTENITALKVGEQIAAGGVFSPEKATRDELTIFAKKSGIEKALLDGTEEGAAAVRDLWNRTNHVLPGNVKTLLEQDASSFDSGRMSRSFALMDTLQAQNPAAFEREMGQEMANKVIAYRTLKGLGVPEESLRLRLNAERLMSPQDLKTLREQADSWFTGKEAFTPQKLEKEFGTYFTGDPRFGQTVEQAANSRLAWQDYSTLFREMYPMYGNPTDTHRAAAEQMKRLYGDFQGTLVKYPPQNYYPQIDQSHDWIMRQFRREQNIQPGDRVLVVSDYTRAEERVRNNMTPTYNMVVIDSKGVPRTVEHWYPDFNEETKWIQSEQQRLGIPSTRNPVAFDALRREYLGTPSSEVRK